VVATLRAAGPAAASPFTATEGPPVAFLLWTVAWFALMIGLTLWSFQRREL
jgi:hypothetical protein